MITGGLGKHILPMIVSGSGGIGIFAGGYYWLQRWDWQENSFLQSSVQSILRKESDKGPVCDYWKTGKEEHHERLSDDRCERVVNYFWGRGRKDQPREWLKVDKDILDNTLWRHYLTKDNSKNKQTENSWEARGLNCTKQEVPKDKVIVKCEVKNLNNLNK